MRRRIARTGNGTKGSVCNSDCDSVLWLHWCVLLSLCVVQIESLYRASCCGASRCMCLSACLNISLCVWLAKFSQKPPHCLCTGHPLLWCGVQETQLVISSDGAFQIFVVSVCAECEIGKCQHGSRGGCKHACCTARCLRCPLQFAFKRT